MVLLLLCGFKNAIGYWGYIGAFGVIAICISAIALFVKIKNS